MLCWITASLTSRFLLSCGPKFWVEVQKTSTLLQRQPAIEVATSRRRLLLKLGNCSPSDAPRSRGSITAPADLTTNRATVSAECPARRHHRAPTRPLIVCGNLVSMTSLGKTSSVAGRRQKSRRARPGQWQLQEAKARFSEVVRRAKQEGPQHVTVHGREEVVVIGADDFRRLAGERSGQALVDAIRMSPHRSTSIEAPRVRMPVRDVDL